MDIIKNTTRQGCAAAHLVCADLLLQGFNAFLASEGLHYDVVMETESRLLRVPVKSTRYLRDRKQRSNSISSYQFLTNRGHRPDPNRKSSPKKYTNHHIDLMACVAIDTKQIAYMPVIGELQSALYFYPTGTPPFVRNGQNQRRCIDQFDLRRALDQIIPNTN